MKFLVFEEIVCRRVGVLKVPKALDSSTVKRYDSETARVAIRRGELRASARKNNHANAEERSMQRQTFQTKTNDACRFELREQQRNDKSTTETKKRNIYAK